MVKRTSLLSCLVLLVGCGGAEALDDEAIDRGEMDIVGGSAANIADHPWQISFQSSGGSHFCGGSILNDRWILTAQHCVAGEKANTISAPATVRIAAGSTKLSAMISGGQIRAVEEIIPYPGYKDPTFGKDVALLRLASPLTLGANVASIALVTEADASAGVTNEGVTATVSGWGTVSSGGSSPDALLKVSIPIASNAKADAAYTESITADQLAAADMVNGGKDSCQGDSGGPLTALKSGKPVLAGVVSWGEGCADIKYPGMYARVSSFQSWISSVIGASAVTLDSRTGVSAASKAWSHFTVNVPAGTPVLNVHASGGTGDADLYVRKAGQPTTATYDCGPGASGNNESCSFGNPASGTWYISLYGYSAFSGVTLKTTTYGAGGQQPSPVEVCGDGADNDADGKIDCADTDCSADASCAAQQTYNDADGSVQLNAWKDYATFTVKPGTTLTAFLDDLTGNPDLYVRWTSLPDTSAYDCRPYLTAGKDETCSMTVPTGVTKARVSVRGRNSGANTYKLNVTYSP